ncbi:MAG: hypothetical protein NTY38_28185, partial [Acidobacteria bacterium]|nr:hypothetical protein [Acidobacteriota bacterium]
CATPRLVYERAQQDNERAQADWQSAQSVADQANQHVTSLANEISEEQKLLDQKSAALEQSKEQIASGDVISPVNGIVVALHGEPGGNVNPSVTNLVELGVDVSLLEVHLEAAPDVTRQVQAGAAAFIQVLELGAEPIQATVKDV